jgi:hypothetical protein
MELKRLLLGRRLATHEQAEQKIGAVAGVPAIGLDGLASSSYGPEAALSILIPLGALGVTYIGPVVMVILVCSRSCTSRTVRRLPPTPRAGIVHRR